MKRFENILCPLIRMVCLVILTQSPSHADIKNWQTGQVILGTEGITPKRFVDLSGWNRDDHNLRYADFSGWYVYGASFQRSWFDNVRFSGVELTNGYFDNAVLTNTDFTDANLLLSSLRNATLTRANLTGADLFGASWNGADLTDAVIDMVDLTGATRYGFSKDQLYSTASYKSRILRRISFAENDLTGWDFSGQDLTDAIFSDEFRANANNSVLANANFSGAIVTGANFNGATGRGFTSRQLYSTRSYQQKNLRGIGLEFNDLSGWDLTGQDLTNASLRRSNLTNADLTGALIAWTNFDAYSVGCDCFINDLTKEQLYSTKSYQEKTLRGIKLSADLTGWDFAGQDLSNAYMLSRFTGANLTGANLSNAFFAGDLNSAIVQDTVYNQWTLGIDPTIQGFTFVRSAVGDLDGTEGLTVSDLELLTMRIRTESQDEPFMPWQFEMFDLNSDEGTNVQDLHMWVVDLKKTWFGDANVDGEFNSSDLVQVFQAGQYEDTISGHSTWSTGDWNADGEFDTSDLVLAFQDGGYEAGSRTAIVAVPEPPGAMLSAAVCLGAVCLVSRVSRRSIRNAQQCHMESKGRTAEVRISMLLIAVGATALFDTTAARGAVDVAEITVSDLTAGYAAGKFSISDVVADSLDRIRRYEPNYNAFTWLNPDAIATAARLDKELDTTGPRGPLHGVPVVVKESMDLVGAPSTFGYAPFSSAAGGVDLFPAVDSTVVTRLKEAGAVILGKTNISVFSTDGNRADTSWAGRTYNAVDRTLAPGGSSSGTATAAAASFTVLGLGEETGGSIQNPAAAQSLVGIKPTFGLVPNTGVAPLAGSTQDVVGPIARIVYDAALTLDALAGFSPEDPKTAIAEGHIPTGGYTSQLSTSALEGKRIGLFGPGWSTEPLRADTRRRYQQATDVLLSQGAVPVEDPFAGSGFASMFDQIFNTPSFRGTTSIVYDFEKYLERFGINAEASSIGQLENLTGMDIFGPGRPLAENISDNPLAKASLADPDVLPDLSGFLAAREQLLGTFNQVMTDHGLDALAFPQAIASTPTVYGSEIILPTSSPQINRMGTPGITVPAGHYENGAPFSLIFLGRFFSEPQLLAYAYDFEQATLARVRPLLIEDRKLLPSQVFAIEDGNENSPRDGSGDRVINTPLVVNTSVGEVDASGSPMRERRMIARFELADLPSATSQLESATLRIQVERISATMPAAIGVFHSVTDNGTDLLKSLFEDASFVDTHLDLTAPIEARKQFLELDVTEFVRQDYALEETEAKSSFRLQLRGEFIDDDVSTRYFVTTPGGGLSPELTLSFGMLGDFDKDGILTVTDVDLLAVAIRAGHQLLKFDLNRDQRVDLADYRVWIQELKRPWFGDADLNGQFDSGDLVTVFQAGQYESLGTGDSTWSTGDWNADGEFDSHDLVLAFQDGGYEQGPRAAVNAVPEPSSLALLFVGLITMVRRHCAK